ncbi:DNA/RNA helicase domain-containing protein [Ureibacillus massiliensis]|uniref:DNA/RNA helicase domain-containing protein n=1 Tax=Ureibacillus massiliensis TaxID=292806 RepID=UPI000AF30DB2
MVSTFDYLHKTDGGVYYITEDNGKYQIPWNITESKFTWAEKAATVNEAGSIYTIQGFDLNYVGVIRGTSISYYEQSDQLVIKTEEYKDIGAY